MASSSVAFLFAVPVIAMGSSSSSTARSDAGVLDGAPPSADAAPADGGPADAASADGARPADDAGTIGRTFIFTGAQPDHSGAEVSLAVAPGGAVAVAWMDETNTDAW